MSDNRKRSRPWYVSAALRLGLALFCIVLFVLALILLKEGAKPFAPLIRNQFSVDSPASALGFGWLSANLTLSGSPVAATSLALLDANVLSAVESFAMIAGSRLGAAFVVLLIGLVYMLRGKQRVLSLNVGLLSLLVTQTMYPLVLALGFFFMSNGWLDRWQVQASQDVSSPLETLINPLLIVFQKLLPTWALFPVGFLLVLSSLWLFDKAIPEIHFEEAGLGLLSHALYRPVVVFLAGALVTSLTMSVSVSLSLLVPLSVRGIIRRENAIPYIMGANITTFIDTLVAAALLANSSAVTVVLVMMISVAVVSLLVMALGFRQYECFLDGIVNFLGRRRRHLVGYIFVIFAVPFVLLIFG